jgi:hypothetical protein
MRWAALFSLLGLASLARGEEPIKPTVDFSRVRGMRPRLGSCGLCVVLCGAANAEATDAVTWKSVAAVETVAVRIHWVSSGELRAAAREVGKRPQTAPKAFSVLRKNAETGVYSCDIYVPKKPERLKDEATATLGHELAHCLGFSHE